jgi:hypothetical protein
MTLPRDARTRARVRALRTAVGAVLALGIAAADAHAVIRRHDRPDRRHTGTAGEYARVTCNVGGAMGTVVGDRWVLTAAHVVANLSPFSRSVRIGGRPIPIAAVYTYPGWTLQRGTRGGDSLDTDIPDLALVRLARSAGGTRPARLNRTPDERGRTAVVVGNGLSGTGEGGPEIEDGLMRAATNVVDEADGNWLSFSFSAPGDSGVTDLEGIGGPGDSGGPLLARRGGDLYVIGVSSLNHQGPADGPSRYRSTEVYARVSHNVAWIDSVMAGRGTPDPVVDQVRPLSEGWPDTPAAKIVNAWVFAYNSRDSAMLVRFEQTFRAESLLAKRPAEARSVTWRALYSEWGRLDPAAIVETPGRPFRLLVYAEKPKRWMRFDFTVPPSATPRLTTMMLNTPEDPPPGRK